MLKITNELKGLDIEFTLDDNDRAILSASVKQQGFDILQKLMEDQVRKFNCKLIDTNPANSAEVVANHYLAKAVAQFYTGFIEKISVECQCHQYNNRNKGIVEESIASSVEEFS